MIWPSRMNRSEARIRARQIAEDIVNGSLPPYEGAMQIWKEILDLLEPPIPDDLWPFKSNASAIEDCLWNAENSGSNHDDLIAQCKEKILIAARYLTPEDIKTLRLPNTCTLQDIVSSIEHEIQDFFWIFSGTVFYNKSPCGEIFYDWNENYEHLFIEEIPFENPHFRLSTQGFLTKYAHFVVADWTEIYGLKSKVALSDVTDSKGWNINESTIKSISEIIFGNIDAAFWIVKSSNQSLLNILKEKFPSATFIAE